MNIEQLTAGIGQRVFSQGAAAYHSNALGKIAPITAVLDRNYQVLDEDQLERSVTVIAVLVSQVAESHEGDTVTRDGQTWRVARTLEDDGFERVLEVYG